MCNQGIENSKSSSSSSSSSSVSLLLQSETLVTADHQLDHRELMESSSSPAPSSEEAPRVKLLCSFGGSIMPRPQDGKLRYVGGETRMVSLPRDVNFEELMARMRELFDGAAVLKYQQPDEDLDALVSVVNDDDVTNMMEEYDKLGSGDGFTRLRMFLFPLPDNDLSILSSSPHFDVDEMDSERRYVDALNSLNDGMIEFRKQQQQQLGESPVMEPLLEFGLHNQRNCEVPLSQFNLQHLTIPHLGQQSHTPPQRYNNEMEAPWSPAYYSPRHLGHHDPRQVSEFPLSPSSGRYRMPFGELHEECVRQQVQLEHHLHQSQFEHHAHQQQYEHSPPFVDNLVWLPAGSIPGDRAGFSGNIGHAHSVFEGNSICENCRMAFHRNQISAEGSRYPDSRWLQGGQPHLEPPSAGTEFHQYPSSCVGCNPNRETYILNPDANLELGVYSKDHNEAQSFCNEAHNHDRGWVLPHHLNHRVEETRNQFPGVARMNEHYVVDNSGVNIAMLHGNSGHQVPCNCVNHDEHRQAPELGNEGLPDQSVGGGSHIHIPTMEDHGIRYGNMPAAHQMSHGPSTAPGLWMKVQNPLHNSPSYEALNMNPQANGGNNLGFPRVIREGSPNFRVDNPKPNLWCGQSQKIYAFDGSAGQGCFHGSASNLVQETHNSFPSNPVRSQIDMRDCVIPLEPLSQMHSSLHCNGDKTQASPASVLGPANMAVGPAKLEEKSMETAGATSMSRNAIIEKNEAEDKKIVDAGLDTNGVTRLTPDKEGGDTRTHCQTDADATFEHDELIKRLSFLPELIASVKKAALEDVEEVKEKVQQNNDGDEDLASKEAAVKALESENGQLDVEADSDSEHPSSSQIEPTKAEEEALARGLQTIKNDDLEEIRELGSGTYGAVYHGKWKGSDVAIKRIKASCFAGKPSERERLIADFWKEALILSSLHHPNVVSFYGIVRDGPDGSLATVTEFMVNGSLKQFLQKKDRTIDRRKRLIIAMDAAIGMEYLHGKNIVHFDLKCENLLVNMRDPHRPVCKIGDLGLSKVKQHTLVSGGVRGTLPWMAPELLSGKSNMVTEKIDVYSFGIVMWELLTGEEPYAEMRCASIIGGIVNNTLRPQIPSWCDPEWKSLMESCWASDPGERPSFAEIAQKLRKMSAAMNVK